MGALNSPSFFLNSTQALLEDNTLPSRQPVPYGIIVKALLISIVAALTAFLLSIWTGNGKFGRRIPGPWSLPVVGSLHAVGMKPHLSLSRLRKRYGDVFRVKIGSVPVVVLCGLDVVKDALIRQGNTFAGRPFLYTLQLASEGKSMAFNSFSAEWKVHRRVAERALRMISDQGHCTTLITREAVRLATSFLDKAMETPYDPLQDIMWSLAHVKYSLCYGDSRASADFHRMIETTLQLIGCHNKGNVLNFFPWARVFRRQEKRLLNICATMLTITKKVEQDHLDTFEAGKIRDALDALIDLSRRPGSGTLDQSQLLHTVQEYIGAGLDIVYLSMAWCVLYLAKFPDVQDCIYTELKTVVGESRTPCLEDSHSMPYTQATIQEILRHSAVVPLALPHSTLQDTCLKGYHIPKDTFILINLYSINRDPKVWSNPDEFCPQRFLESGSSTEDRFCPYGLGRRKCVGEQLSKNELFLYVANLVQKCRIQDATEGGASLEPMAGIVLRPKPFQIRVTPR